MHIKSLYILYILYNYMRGPCLDKCGLSDLCVLAYLAQVMRTQHIWCPHLAPPLPELLASVTETLLFGCRSPKVEWPMTYHKGTLLPPLGTGIFQLSFGAVTTPLFPPYSHRSAATSWGERYGEWPVWAYQMTLMLCGCLDPVLNVVLREWLSYDQQSCKVMNGFIVCCSFQIDV